MKRAYKIICKLADGQRVPVANCDDLNEARQTVASLSGYWPNDYAILSSSSEELPESSAKLPEKVQ